MTYIFAHETISSTTDSLCSEACLSFPLVSSFLPSANYAMLSVTVGEFHLLKFHICEILQYVHLEAVVGVSLLCFSLTVTSMLLCVGRVRSFLLLNAIPLYGCIKICLSIYMLTYMLTSSHFWLLKIELLWIFIYKSFFPVVLRYNWYTKICMKLYIWWFWTYVYTHVIITTVMEINIEIASKSFIVPFAAMFVCVSGVCTFL